MSSTDILLISALKDSKIHDLNILMKKSSISDEQQLINKLFKLFHKKVKRLYVGCVVSEQQYLINMFSFIRNVIEVGNCDLAMILVELDLCKREVEEKMSLTNYSLYADLLNNIQFVIIDCQNLCYQINRKNNGCKADTVMVDFLSKILNTVSCINSNQKVVFNMDSLIKSYQHYFSGFRCMEYDNVSSILDLMSQIVNEIEKRKDEFHGQPFSREIINFLHELEKILNSEIEKLSFVQKPFKIKKDFDLDLMMFMEEEKNKHKYLKPTDRVIF